MFFAANGNLEDLHLAAAFAIQGPSLLKRNMELVLCP